MQSHRSYFIEFPRDLQSLLPAGVLSPMCGDRSDFSFLFRKGSPEHYRKLIVEFEGGPACWGNQCSCDASDRQVPWQDYAQAYNDTDDQALPRLGSCHGVVPDFVSTLTSSLFDNTTAFDVPLMERQESGWWDKIDNGNNNNNMKDWSYILIPHCTLDWHLGYGQQGHVTGCDTERLEHRGAANRDAVLAWVVRQFGREEVSWQDFYFGAVPAMTGLQGLVTVAGGSIGGCDLSNPQEASASVASAIFANRAASYFTTMESALVVVEGASLFHPALPQFETFQTVLEAVELPFGNLPYDLKYFVGRAPSSVHHVWVSSSDGGMNAALEEQLLREMEQARGDRFHRFTPSSDYSSNAFEKCPKYAFPRDNEDESFGKFLEGVVRQLSWTYAEAPAIGGSSFASSDASDGDSLSIQEVLNGNGEDTGTDDEVTLRLSWLAVAVICVAIVVFAYMVYFALRYHRSKKNSPPPIGPYQIWLYALTHYPRCFLLVSLGIPIFLSWLAVSRAGYTVNINLDFQSYLAISSGVTIVSDNYDGAVAFQETSSKQADLICNALGDWGIYKPDDRRSLAWLEGQSSESDANTSRHLQGGDDGVSQRPALYRTTLQVIYEKRNGGNVFTPTLLEELKQFERDVIEYPRYEEFCRRLSDGSCRFGTPLSWLLEADGTFVDDIEGTLAEKATPEKVDQYFNIPNNLASNMTKSFIYFQGESSEAVNSFLKGFYEDFLIKRDQERYYPNLVFTWENGFLLQQEANEALLHDALWSVGSLVVIGIMIYLKVQDFFVFFFGMLGLILAFTTSYYWCTAHFGIPEITLLHIAGLFVMLGIGADDIFLMVDSYEHAKIGMVAEEDEEDGSNQNQNQSNSSFVESSADPDANGREESRVEKIRKQMLWAYSTAGGMMLVSSMTAAVCFFSNAFGVLVVIQDFGIYMGMVVLINFFHVMTILPSAILVNEIYFKPFCCCCCSGGKKGDEDIASTDLNGSYENNGAPGRKSGYDVEASLHRHESTGNPRHSNGNENLGEIAAPSSLGLMDRILYNGYAPFLVRRRIPILALSILFAIIIGSLGLANLEFTDGSIIIFSNEYNQGRLTSIKNNYYSQVDPASLSLGGSIGSVGGSGTGGSVGSIGGDAGSGSGGFSGGTGGNSGGNPGSNPGTGGNGGSTGGGGSVGGGGTTGGTGGTGGGTNSNGGGGGAGSNGGGTGSGGGTGGVTPTPNDGNGVGGGGGIGGGTPVASPTMRPTAPTPSQTPGINTGNETSSLVETSVKLLWGIDTQSTDTTGPWRVKSSMKKVEDDEKSLLAGVSGFDVTKPANQQWLLEVVLAARATKSLNAISSEPTWIEMLADFARKQDGGFPIQKELFTSYVEILKFKDPAFEEIVKDEIGTSLPGLAGQPLYASVTFQSRASSSLGSFSKWTEFSDTMNEKAPSDIPPMVAQSDLFWNSARAQETIDATVNTWLLANLLCFAIILFFTQNLLLSAMVIGTIILMFMCIAGWLFFVLDRALGPVQALGVSIFIGLSANYSLHVVHAYHRSKSANRKTKVKQAIFITGSPICASAISTIGGCVFLFGCRAIPLVELGILICCVTAMALLYSMGFLLAWLLVMGPLPSEDASETMGRQLHRWDIYWVCHVLSRRCMTGSTATESRTTPLQKLQSSASSMLSTLKANLESTQSSASESRTTPVQKLRGGASSILSTVKVNLEGRLSKKSSNVDEIKDAERDNTRSIPTFPSSASNLSSDNAAIHRDDPISMSSDVMQYPIERAGIAPSLYEPGVGEGFRQHQDKVESGGSSAQIRAQPSGFEVSTEHSTLFDTREGPPQNHPPSMPIVAQQTDYAYNNRGLPPMLYSYSENENLQSVQALVPVEPLRRAHAVTHGIGLGSTAAEPVSTQALGPGDELLSGNVDISSSSNQISKIQMPLENCPPSIQKYSDKEEDSNDNWDLSSIMSYISGTSGIERAGSTTIQPTSMLVLGPQDDHSVASGLGLDPIDHPQGAMVSNSDLDNDWDLSSIMSYISGTERAATTTTQPTSMLMPGPQDGHNAAPELALDPVDHLQGVMVFRPTDMDDEGSVPFDEM
ncbi:unnamed protein product [Cylindrotheca closterium]|uniref:SSD domain-containing protein n=1 Tax=Cylindrotheca closterium TaxID=2856 RepID=A0AAD2CQ89_9STRA|nr:unnamed protein product [Cylindrotheca closterium]